MITIKRTNSNDPDFISLVNDLDKDLWKRYGTAQLEYQPYNIIENLQTVVIANTENSPVGCGCFKKLETDTVEVKRMYVMPEQRGKGIGTLLMKELEKWARESGFEFIVLETGSGQPEALHLYKKQGYSIIPNYGQYSGMKESICMKKILLPPETE